MIVRVRAVHLTIMRPGLLVALATACAAFEASNVWQEVAEDEPLPAGLEIRMNIDTGRREARLAQDSGNEPQEGQIIEVEGAQQAEYTQEEKTFKVHRKVKRVQKEQGILDKLFGGLNALFPKSDDNQTDQTATFPVRPQEQAPAQRPKLDAKGLFKKGQTPTIECSVNNDEAVLGSGLLARAHALVDCGQLTPDVLDELEEWSHDREFGIKVVESGLAWKLVGAAVSPNSSDEFRQWCIFIVGGSIRNNVPALQMMMGHPEDAELFLSSVINAIDNDSISDKIASRFVYLLSSCIGTPGTLNLLTDIGGGTVLRRAFEHRPAVRTKLCRFVDAHLVPQGHESSEDALVQATEALAWSNLLQDSLASTQPGQEVAPRMEQLETLIACHQHLNLPVKKEFLKWLASSDRKKEPQEFLSLINASRHAVFGNPNAQRKHDADEL